tara:strand:- start:79 stop:870 length:792 start_codon:yes stop_codon:yes gene_type:complete
MTPNFSKEMFSETEKLGQIFSLDTHSIIFDRYKFAYDLSQFKKVLEIGPGSGIGIDAISTNAKTYSCLEFSIENVELLKKQYKKSLNIYHGDAHNLPYEDESFNLLIALAMVYYLDMNIFLKEVNRVLEKGGTFFFCTSNKDVPGFVESPFTTKYYSVNELNSILRENGFSCEFYGAFPKFTGNLTIQKYKSNIKFFLKKLFFYFPFGKTIWENFRIARSGIQKPLPKKIKISELKEAERVLLDSNKSNKKYRVIYTLAKKIR